MKLIVILVTCLEEDSVICKIMSCFAMPMEDLVVDQILIGDVMYIKAFGY